MAPAPRFGIVLLPETLADFGGLCREVEERGYAWLGVADSQSVFRELYVMRRWMREVVAGVNRPSEVPS